MLLAEELPISTTGKAGSETLLFDVEADSLFQPRFVSPAGIRNGFEHVGFDTSYAKVAERKFRPMVIAAQSLRSPAANILKQTCLGIGAEAATHKQVITCNIDKAPVMISATQGQWDQIQKKLRPQPFGLPKLAESIYRMQQRQAWLERQPLKTMGILNITPDSFSDGGQFYSNNGLNTEQLLQTVSDWVALGVDAVEIGGESTRPGAEEITLEEELKRVIPAIKELKQHFLRLTISVDTRKAAVAQAATNAGATMINDVSGLCFDDEMLNVAVQSKAHVVIMHSQGTPATMQNNPQYQDVVEEIAAFFYQQITKAISAGVKPEKIILDPGIGFGKTKDHNTEIFNRLSELCSIGFPVMLGVSRKSFLSPETMPLVESEREAITAASTALGAQAGCKWFRVHDVKQQLPVVQWLNQLNNN